MNRKLRHHFGDNPIVWVPAWGISKLRKRAGRFAGAILGEARWYDDWYDRVMSEETARKLADLGVNLVILPFSIGGSDAVERGEREDFERMTAHLHAQGIVSLPYLQYQNLLQEYHVLEGTVWAEGLDGARTGFAYWRRTACQAAPAFLGYMKGLIDDAVERGADGIWIDNTYKKPCRCPLCLDGFRDFLARNRAHLLDELRLPDFTRMELPPAPFNRLTDYAYDPVVQAYIDFLCEQNLAIHRVLKEHLESRSPMGLYASNPGLYRGLAYGERGMDLYELVRMHDLMYLENKLFPEVQGTRAVGNYHGFICCQALGSVGIPGAWKPHVDFDSTHSGATQGLPETAGEVEAILYEAAAFNGSPGLFWAVRSRSHADADSPEALRQMQMDRPELYEPARKAIAFIKSLPGGARRNAAEVGVFYHRASQDLNHADTAASIHAVEELLLTARIPYDLLFSNTMADIARFRLLVCPSVKLLSDAEADILRSFVKNGGRLLVLGPIGAHDERNRIREEAALHDVTGVSAFGVPERWTRNAYGAGRVSTLTLPGRTEERIPCLFPAATLVYPRWTEAGPSITEELAALLPDGPQVEVKGGGVLGVTVSVLESGRSLVQVVCYDRDVSGQPLEIGVRCDVAEHDTGRIFVPGEEPSDVGCVAVSGRRTFKVKEFQSFCALLV